MFFESLRLRPEQGIAVRTKQVRDSVTPGNQFHAITEDHGASLLMVQLPSGWRW